MGRKDGVVKKALNAGRAILTAERVSLEVFEERQAICGSCDHIVDGACRFCGCDVRKTHGAIVNLPKVVENLPAWGCKHPQRVEGMGWLR